MTFQVYELGGSGQTTFVSPPIVQTRAPAATDLYSPNGNSYQIGQLWLNQPSLQWFIYAGAGNWSLTTSTGPYSPSTFTAHGVLIGEGTAAIQATAAGSSGQVLLGSTGANPAFGTLTSTTGISYVTGAAALAINVISGGYAVNAFATGSATLAPQTMYVCSDSSQVAFTLPTTAAVGDTYQIIGTPANTGGFKITVTAGQTIYQGTNASTESTGKASSASNANEACCIVCTVANTSFCIIDANDTFTFA